jgi:hypothetical protein
VIGYLNAKTAFMQGLENNVGLKVRDEEKQVTRLFIKQNFRH